MGCIDIEGHGAVKPNLGKVCKCLRVGCTGLLRVMSCLAQEVMVHKSG